jgi:hypothetical protein
MGYVPQRPEPPENMKAHFPDTSHQQVFNRAVMDADKLKAIERELRDRFDPPSFWSPFTITVAICALCFGSYIAGVFVGMREGARVARAMAEAE